MRLSDIDLPRLAVRVRAQADAYRSRVTGGLCAHASLYGAAELQREGLADARIVAGTAALRLGRSRTSFVQWARMPEGYLIPHAWIEADGHVIDFSLWHAARDSLTRFREVVRLPSLLVRHRDELLPSLEAVRESRRPGAAAYIEDPAATARLLAFFTDPLKEAA